MLDHLLTHAPDIEPLEETKASFEPVKRVHPQKLINAQRATAQWLQELGAPGDQEIIDAQHEKAAQEAFGALVTAQPEEKQREALLRLKAPAAYEKLDSMLTAYDWEFVERAKELRSYTVTKIIQETEHHDARIRLRALELLGKVTEVGLFTERIEVKKVEVGDNELEARVREKLQKFLRSNGQLEDAQVKEHTADAEMIEILEGDGRGVERASDSQASVEDGDDASRPLLRNKNLSRKP